MARPQTLQVRSIHSWTWKRVFRFSSIDRQGFGEPDGASPIVFDDAQVSRIVYSSDVKQSKTLGQAHEPQRVCRQDRERSAHGTFRGVSD